eukprot:scaffold40724_cov58-Phaeocystis_antarctica.AAC.1
MAPPTWRGDKQGTACTEERCTNTPTLRIDHGLQGTPPLSTRAEAENSETTIAPGSGSGSRFGLGLGLETTIAPGPPGKCSRASRYSKGSRLRPSRTW